MSNITQFFTPTTKKINKRVFIGPVSTTWTVPSGISEVEVHCWGGGGNGGFSYNPSGSYVGGAGGGGGGYVTHTYPVTAGQVLSIVVGGQGATSSVSCPSQSPISPISATGGASASFSSPGAGGSGSATIAPGVDISRTLTASGGSGGFGYNGGTNPGGGGGAAGSIYGNGGDGGYGYYGYPASGGSGGGIGGVSGSPANTSGYITSGGNSVTIRTSSDLFSINNFDQYSSTGGVGLSTSNRWFYVTEITGTGGINNPNASTRIPKNGAGCGGAGGAVSTPLWPGAAAEPGGFLGGGGGATNNFPTAADGGVAGGGGGGSNYGPTSSGGVGCVILYW